MDKIWYDTGSIEPGQHARLFDKKNIGEYHKTNIPGAGVLHYEMKCSIRSIGVRLIGKSRSEEDLLLDHLHVTLSIGDHPQFDILGPHASTLRHVLSKEELDRLEIQADDAPSFERMGYHLKNHIVVPIRQNMSVQVFASKQLPEAVNFRVYLYGERFYDVG